MTKVSTVPDPPARRPAPLKPIDAEPGRPLYTTVRNALLRAIDAGHFPVDQRLPSTKELSEQMSVSLVTAHRALRELVGEGFLDRSRGRGTYIIDRSSRAAKKLRICVLIDREASLVDEHHSRLVEGMRQASAGPNGPDADVELTVSHGGAPTDAGIDGYLLLDPPEHELAGHLAQLPAGTPRLVVGSPPADAEVSGIGIDHHAVAELLVDHLMQMGHRRLAFLGSGRSTGGNRSLRSQIEAVCRDRGIGLPESHLLSVAGWRVDDAEKMSLFRLLDRTDRPTALIAARFYFALDVYEAAATLGSEIARDLSVVGIGNPASAGHLAPPLTCIQEPLVELGHAAIDSIIKAIEKPSAGGCSTRTLRPELVIRKSVARL